jgi:hypothetical protein
MQLKFKSAEDANFQIQAGLLGKFAIVKLWPDLKTAEDECIARIKLAAIDIGVECVEINSDGFFLDEPNKRVNQDNIDFVIHLHYDTPKSYDAFSFAALWNPVRFYHEWGFSRTSRNLTTHDDFISCSSEAADNHVRSMVEVDDQTLLSPEFKLYHSTPGIIFEPSLGDQKLFYVGINWEKITGGKARHQEVLERLDKTGLLRIYGPTLFQGVKVWAGYKSYVKEIPFDGVSMLREISKVGISLVLSSPAHKESGLMSSRLFESIAAGALIICDENPFAKTNFGDTLLYIDSRDPIEKTYKDIVGHIEWAITNPQKALDKIAAAQEIFKGQFNLRTNLMDLYDGLNDRKKHLKQQLNPSDRLQAKVASYFLMPAFSEEILKKHLASIAAQDYEYFYPVLVLDSALGEERFEKVQTALENVEPKIKIIKVDLSRHVNGSSIHKRMLGDIISELIALSNHVDAFMIIAPNESLFSNHVSVLTGALNRNIDASCAATAAIIRNGETVHAVNELLDFGHVDRLAPPGYGRFIFRINKIPDDAIVALKTLDGRPIAALIGKNQLLQQFQATIEIEIKKEFPERTWDEAAENLIIKSYCPEVMNIFFGINPQQIDGAYLPPKLSLKQFWLKFVNVFWLKGQIKALKREGFAKRLKVLKRKLGSL